MTTRRLLVLGLAAVTMAASVAMLLGAGWLAPAEQGSTGEPPARLALGQRIYGERCASCHGANLEGQPDWQRRRPNGRLPAPPHDETGHTWHHPDGQLIELTRNGLAAIAPGYESDMPAFRGVLSDDEIGAVIAYIGSTWPPEIRRRRAERLGTAAARP